MASQEPGYKMDGFDLVEIEMFALESSDLDIDCNGAADLMSLLLERMSVDHTRMCGLATHTRTGNRVFPHCWLELPGGFIVDVRLQKWLGDRDDIPHGVFDKSDCSIVYQGDLDPRERMSMEEIHELVGIGKDFDGIQI